MLLATHACCHMFLSTFSYGGILLQKQGELYAAAADCKAMTILGLK